MRVASSSSGSGPEPDGGAGGGEGAVGVRRRPRRSASPRVTGPVTCSLIGRGAVAVGGEERPEPGERRTLDAGSADSSRTGRRGRARPTTSMRPVGGDVDAPEAPETLRDHALPGVEPGQRRGGREVGARGHRDRHRGVDLPMRQASDGRRGADPEVDRLHRFASAREARDAWTRGPISAAPPLGLHDTGIATRTPGEQILARCPLLHDLAISMAVAGHLARSCPVLAGPALADALADRSRAVQVVGIAARVGDLGGSRSAATLVPRSVTLTVVRVVVPGALAVAAWAALGAERPAWAAVGVAAGAVASLAGAGPGVADAFVDGSSYGTERRVALRVPIAVLARSGAAGVGARRVGPRRRAAAARRPSNGSPAASSSWSVARSSWSSAVRCTC